MDSVGNGVGDGPTYTKAQCRTQKLQTTAVSDYIRVNTNLERGYELSWANFLVSEQSLKVIYHEKKQKRMHLCCGCYRVDLAIRLACGMKIYYVHCDSRQVRDTLMVLHHRGLTGVGGNQESFSRFFAVV